LRCDIFRLSYWLIVERNFFGMERVWVFVLHKGCFLKVKPRHLIVAGFSFVILSFVYYSIYSFGFCSGAKPRGRDPLAPIGCGSFGCHKKLKILDTFGIIRVMVCCNGNQITGQADEKPNICSTSMAVGSIKIIVFIGLKFEGMIDF